MLLVICGSGRGLAYGFGPDGWVSEFYFKFDDH